jgi:3-hydroxyacyl-[acyl-carrier-protein] dehydratase
MPECAMTDSPVNLDSADIVRILELLPHRYPFLLVDRIVEIDGDKSCVGIKNVTFNEPQFTGHFPSRPVFPGVLLIEAMAQTAGAICVLSKLVEQERPKQVFFMTIDKAKFRKPVLPGDRVEFHMRKLNQKRSMWWFEGKAKVEGVLVCEAEIGASLAAGKAAP